MSQPPTAPQDPYQFDPYRPQGTSPAPQGDPQPAPGAPAYAPSPEQAPYGSDPATAPYGSSPEQAPYGAPGQAPASAPQGYGQPYPDPAQQGYAAPYGDPAQQQGYPQPYPDPAQQPYGSPYNGGYPAYGAAASSTSTLAIVGFVLAILGFLGSWIPFLNLFAVVLGIAGVVLGFVGLSQVKRGRTGKGFSIAAIALGVASVLVTIAIWVVVVVAANNASSQYEQAIVDLEQETSEWDEELDRMSGEATEEILANDLGVEFGAFEGEPDEYGWVESTLPLTLTNTSDEPLTFDLDVDAIAADGTVIESDFAYTDELAPGESETVEVFTYIDEENLEAMRTATFEVTRASAY